MPAAPHLLWRAVARHLHPLLLLIDENRDNEEEDDGQEEAGQDPGRRLVDEGYLRMARVVLNRTGSACGVETRVRNRSFAARPRRNLPSGISLTSVGNDGRHGDGGDPRHVLHRDNDCSLVCRCRRGHRCCHFCSEKENVHGSANRQEFPNTEEVNSRIFGSVNCVYKSFPTEPILEKHRANNKNNSCTCQREQWEPALRCSSVGKADTELSASCAAIKKAL